MDWSRLTGLAVIVAAVVALALCRPALFTDAAMAEVPAANVRSAQFGAVGDGVRDDTAAIQKAVDQSLRVFIPQGVYRINPRVGLVLRSGSQLIGEGREHTVLLAAPGGGTVKELAAYGPGSIIRRAFNSLRPNSYVNYVRIVDLAVVMSHPSNRITTDSIQIGIDLRNVSRSLVERVHVGNSPPLGGKVAKPRGHTFDSQGYGIVLGTLSSSARAYAGGEANTIRDSNVWGAYKAIVQDDLELSPLSAAHSTMIERSDLQGAEYLLSQESRYAHATSWRDNLVQNIVPRNDHPGSGVAYAVAGQDAMITGDYVELGPLAAGLAQFGRESKRVDFRPGYVDCSQRSAITNEGADNTIARTATCAGASRRD